MSSAKIIDFEGSDWAGHRQDHWLDFAGHPDFPDYLRLTFVAYAKHTANGHAVMERGQLAHFLVRKNGTLPERRVLWDAMQKSIRLGFLDPASQLLCLVVPQHDVQKAKGDPSKPCRRDHTKRKNVRNDTGRFSTNVRNGARRSGSNVRDDDGRSEVSVRNDTGRSTLRPSLSSLSLVSGAPAPELPDTNPGEEIA